MARPDICRPATRLGPGSAARAKAVARAVPRGWAGLLFAPLVLAALLLAAPAFALVPIAQEKTINDTLRSGFIADQIADACPTLEPRKLRALNELLKLRDYALGLGYSRDEVRAFVESKDEKARGKREAAAWLKAKGAVPGQPDAYCTVGEAEIARGSLIGTLLRSVK